jgi:hypothetical protein
VDLVDHRGVGGLGLVLPMDPGLTMRQMGCGHRPFLAAPCELAAILAALVR